MKFLRYVIGTAAALLLASSAADGAHVTTVRSAVARDAAGSSSDITNPDRNNSSPTMAVTGQGSVDITTVCFDSVRVVYICVYKPCVMMPSGPGSLSRGIRRIAWPIIPPSPPQ